MLITKPQELHRAFMGGLAAWVIQAAVVLAWVYLGAHKISKPSLAHAATVGESALSQ